MYEKEKSKLIKNALKLVDKLAEMGVDDNRDEIDELIEKSRKLKRNSLWKLN